MVTHRVTEHTAEEALIQIRGQRHLLEGCSAWDVFKNRISNIKCRSGWKPIYVGGMHVRAWADIEHGCSHHKSLSLADAWGWRWSWREDLLVGCFSKGPGWVAPISMEKLRILLGQHTKETSASQKHVPPTLLLTLVKFTRLVHTDQVNWLVYKENKVGVGLYTIITMRKSSLPSDRPILVKAFNQV